MLSTNSLITVVVPVAEKHLPLLPRAIFSVENQTYPCNLLVVNDSGTDISLGEISLLSTGGNRGSSFARNIAVDRVTTPLVMFLDADDFLLDTTAELFLRAFIHFDDCCYVYGDWIQFSKDGTYKYLKAKHYDRLRQIRHSIHLVTCLYPTELVREVRFSETYRGWEDVEFSVRMGEKGYCGCRIPENTIIYDMTTSINREKHNAIQDEVYNEILDKYRDYLEGAKEFMPCQTCGGNKARFQKEFNAVPPEPQQGMTTLEYTGQNTGPINFTVGSGFNRKVYRGANDESFRYINVPNEDVNELMSKGPWRKVVKASKPAQVPQPEEFNQWREINKTPVSDNWTQLFKRDAVVIKEVVEEEPGVKVVEKPTKKSYQPKRHRRTKAEMLAARQSVS